MTSWLLRNKKHNLKWCKNSQTHICGYNQGFNEGVNKYKYIKRLSQAKTKILLLSYFS